MNNPEEKSYYEILGLDKVATQEEIRKKYKQLVLKFHPDKLPEDKKQLGEAMIKGINEAYNILNDPEKKQIYDQFGKEGLREQGGVHAGFPFNPADLFGGFSDFGNMFQKKQHHQKISPIKISVTISLEDVFLGVTLEQLVDRYVSCKTCDKTGFSDKQKKVCPKCKGVGSIHQVIKIAPGMMQQVQRPCDYCSTSGLDVKSETICTNCKGMKLTSEQHKLKIKIDPGIRAGDVIDIKNEGHESLDENDKKGKILVLIEEKSHNVFKRGVVIHDRMNPANICLELKINFVESLCGFIKSFKHLDGKEHYISKHNVIQNGDIYFIEEHGLPYRGKNKRGDLFIKFIVENPENFSSDKKRKIYELLTGQKYKTDKKKESTSLKLKSIDVYENSNSDSSEDDNNEHDNDPGPENAQQCAQM